MGRKMPYRVVLSALYQDEAKTRFPVIYLLHGLTGHFDNWTDRTRIEEYVARRRVIVVTPEGGDGWYTDSASAVNDKYESYVVRELIPEIDKKFRTLADRDHRVIAGLSMGGYGALKFGLKYPEMFTLAGSFSGALDAPARGVGGKSTWPSILNVYGTEGSETRKGNDIFSIVNSMTSDLQRPLPFLYIDCGTEDFLIGTNRNFAALLLEKKIPHEFRQLPGTHNWAYWDAQLKEFLEVAERHLNN